MIWDCHRVRKDYCCCVVEPSWRSCFLVDVVTPSSKVFDDNGTEKGIKDLGFNASNNYCALNSNYLLKNNAGGAAFKAEQKRPGACCYRIFLCISRKRRPFWSCRNMFFIPQSKR
jgi:hypothetical protein